MKRASIFLLLLFVTTLVLFLPASIAQSGNAPTTIDKNVVLNVVVHHQDGQENINIDKERLLLFDASIQQQIDYLRADRTGSYVVILVDNSQTLRSEVEVLQKIVKAIVGELYEGDSVMVIGFNEQAEIIQDFTGDLKLLRAAVDKFQRKGFPKLYDAIAATIEDAFRKKIGVNKRAIVLLSDGYDRESSVKYEKALASLLDENILLYAFQAPDRTYGAIRPKEGGPKPEIAITNLAEYTGGKVFKIEKAEDAFIEASAKAITDELKENIYTLSYSPKGINTVNARRLLITCSDEKVTLRTKKMHPARER